MGNIILALISEPYSKWLWWMRFLYCLLTFSCLSCMLRKKKITCTVFHRSQIFRSRKSELQIWKWALVSNFSLFLLHPPLFFFSPRYCLDKLYFSVFLICKWLFLLFLFILRLLWEQVRCFKWEREQIFYDQMQVSFLTRLQCCLLAAGGFGFS